MHRRINDTTVILLPVLYSLMVMVFTSVVVTLVAIMCLRYFQSEQIEQNQPRYGLISSQLEEPSQRLATSARVKRIIDGDTLVLEVTKELRVRMLDCWAAEIRTKNLEEKNKGLAAKKYLESLINTDDIVLVDIPITEKLQDSISLGRFLAYIYADTDGDGILDNISDLMVKAGHATKSKPAIGKNDE